MLGVLGWVPLGFHSQHAIVAQCGGDCGGVHILWQLTLVCEGVHNSSVSSKLLGMDFDLIIGGGDNDIFRGEVTHIHSKLVVISEGLDVPHIH